MYRLILLVSFFLLSSLGCAEVQRPTPEQLDKADYGSYPTNYREIITQYISSILIDSNGAVFSNWRGPSKGWYGNWKGSFYGYRVCVSVSVKNKMGNYTGDKWHLIVIKNGLVLVHDFGDYREGSVDEKEAYATCMSL